MNHDQVTLEYDGEPVEVDAGLAQLLDGLWTLGIGTAYSCQDAMGSAYISFSDADSALAFVQVVGSDVIWSTGPERTRHWEFLWNPRPSFMLGTEGEGYDPQYVVYWPVEDTVMVERRVLAATSWLPTKV